MDQKFFICKSCGNIVTPVNDSGTSLVCCGDKMTELIPGAIKASKEMHVPVWSVRNCAVYVKVGAKEHPMLPVHYIEWIAVQTKRGLRFKRLRPGEKPEARFALCADDEVEAVFAYCNIHGLWKS